jgi:hypothetical protein
MMIDLKAAARLLAEQRAEEAECAFRRLLEADPACDEAAYRLGISLLMQGRYAEAWPWWDRRPSRTRRPIRGPTAREWMGEDLAGKTVVVMGEQGIGDQLMFARFVPLLRERCPARIILACDDDLIDALRDTGADEVISRTTASSLPANILWAMIGSLPGRLGIVHETLPLPYAPTVKVTTGGGIGFVGQGQAAHFYDQHRSMPAEITLPGTRPLARGANVLESFKIVADLDLVITVDTAWAHIAGGLGKPVWVLLHHFGLDWRWLRERETTAWYPSARLFRQPAPGDWASVLAEVKGALKA